MFEPVYDSYAPAIELAGGKVVRMRLACPTTAGLGRGGRRDRAAHADHDQHPHNPTATVAKDDLDRLAALTATPASWSWPTGIRAHRLRRRHMSCAAHPELAQRWLRGVELRPRPHHRLQVGYILAPRG